MKFFPQLQKVWGIAKARYDAAFDESRSRSTIYNPVQNATRDITRHTRHKLISKSRYFYNNSTLYALLIERLVSFVVGGGLTVNPKSSNEKWNAEAAAIWEEFCKDPDISSDLDFTALQSLICRSIFVDGDCLTMMTFDEFGLPKVQCLESHRITDRLGGGYQDAPDGCILNEYNRVIGYNYSKTENKISYDTIDHANAILHIFPTRLNQYRGVPVATAALNTLHDIDDILKLEKQAVKENSSRAGVIKRQQGEESVGDLLKGKTVKSPDGKERIEYYRNAKNAEVMILQDGDDYESIVSNRPSQTWQGFMQWLCEMSVASTGLPPSVVLGNKVGGADTRRDLGTSERVIIKWQKQLAAQFQRIYEYVILSNIYLGKLSAAPADWKNSKWQFPPKASVDAGRDANNDRADVSAGLMSRENHFAKRGLNWKAEIKQAAEEASFIKQLCEEKGLNPADIDKTLAQRNNQNA